MGSLRVGEKMLSDAAWQGTYRVPSVFPLYRHQSGVQKTGQGTLLTRRSSRCLLVCTHMRS